MADNVVANAGSGGATFATDDIGGIQFPRTKQAWGADGVATDVDSGAAALPIQDGGNSITVDGSVSVSDGGGSITVDGTVAATQSGTWTVGNASGASAVNIQDGGNSITVDGTVGVSGTVTVSGTITANAGTGPFPVSDNAGSLTVDAPVGTPVFVRLSDGAAAISALPVTDNSGSLTVDGSVTVTQATAANLNATVGNGSGASAVNVQDGGNSLTVDNGGTFVVQSGPRTSGGLTMSKTISAASTNATSLKGSAGQVYAIQAFNLNAAARYLKLYNKATAPTVGSDTPVKVLLIPGNTAGAGFVAAWESGLAFATGIAWALTTGIADSDTGAVAANEIAINIDYA